MQELNMFDVDQVNGGASADSALKETFRNIGRAVRDFEDWWNANVRVLQPYNDLNG